MASLDKAVQEVNNVELNVAFLYPYNLKPFSNGKTAYYPIFTGNILKESILQRFFGRKNNLYTKEYLDIIEIVKPDIIHIHGTENTFHTILGRTNVPVVISIQGNPSVYAYKFRSGFHGFAENDKNSNLTFKSFLLGRNSFHTGLKELSIMAKLEQRTLLDAKYIIGRTDWDRRITRVLAPNSKYFVGNEALRDVFYRNEWNQNQPSSKLIIHTTNGNNYYKGLETLCYALSLLNNMGVDVEWRVAGISKNSKIVDITKRFLKENYPKKGLVLMGSLNEEQLVQSLLESHLYVMPSHIENSPNNLCEAMILGMPCVATLAGGTDSMLENKKEGLIIQDGDPWSMAGAIMELKNNWEKALYYGKNAREKAQNRHDRNSIVESLVNIYKTIIDENPSSLSI